MAPSMTCRILVCIPLKCCIMQAFIQGYFGVNTTLSTITNKSQDFIQKTSAFDLLFLLLCTSPPQLQTEVFGSTPCPFITLLCFTANPYGNRTCKVMDSYKNLIILKPCTVRFLLLLDTMGFPGIVFILISFYI